MTKEKMRIAVNEHNGWNKTGYQSSQLQASPDAQFWVKDGRYVQLEQLPPVDSDLNAVADILRSLTIHELSTYTDLLLNNGDHFDFWNHATVMTGFVKTPGECCLALIRLWGIKE